MQYNIFISTFQKEDNIFKNIYREFNFYKLLAPVFIKYNIYGATISKNIGFYEGKKEKSYQLYIVTDINTKIIIKLCKELRAIFNQNSVMLQVINKSILIYSNKIENI